MCIIYILKFPSGKNYIGLTTKTLEHRLNQHITNAINQRNKSPLVENAIRKYGSENIIVEVLMELDYDWELPGWEKAYIEEYKTKVPSGYNLTDGGEGNSSKHTYKFKLEKSKQMRKNCAEMDLEMYVKYARTKKGTEGFIVQRPGFKSAQFCSPDQTLHQKLQQANEYAKNLDNGIEIVINRYKHVDIGYENIPKGISYLSKFDGFRVTPPGKNTKWFKSKKLTRDQKYNLALEYYYN